MEKKSNKFVKLMKKVVFRIKSFMLRLLTLILVPFVITFTLVAFVLFAILDLIFDIGLVEYESKIIVGTLYGIYN